MKRLLIFLSICLVSLALYISFFAPSTDLYSPLSPTLPTTYNPKPKSYVIMGFAPYWNLKKLSAESLTSITHFAYFNLHLNGDGTIYTKVNRREEDPAYTNYKRLLANTVDRGDKPVIITLMPESQAALSQSISSANNRKQTITTIMSTIQESGALGVNIDYEPLGDITQSLRDNFTLFIKELRLELDSQGGPQKLLTISTYASAASRPRLWDMSALSSSTDYFVIMTYDYTMPSSSSAGPNSPLRGSGSLFEHDIIKNIAEITKVVPSRKILLGIPFYGYEWDTVDDSKYSPVETKGSVASLERIDEMLAKQTLSLIWDRNTLTPYGVSSESGQTSQIYFENATSLKLKLDFVKSADLGGIAIWALGYEGKNSWVWPIINSLK